MPRSTARYPDSGLHSTRNLRSRRRIQNRSPSFAAAGARPRKDGAAGTPLLRWKFNDADHSGKSLRLEPGEKTCRNCNNAKTVTAPTVSARKLAARIWHSTLQEIVGGGGRGGEPVLGHPQLPHGLKHGFFLKNGIFHKHQSSAVLPNTKMERATKWDTECSKPSDEVYRSFDHLKLLVDQQLTKASTPEAKLQAELDRARARINELESKRHLSKEKLDHFSKKLSEEKASWRTREHEKIRAVIDGMKDDLSIERKNRRRTEILNLKLVDELAEAKKSAKRFLQDYEKEKKARELVEEVCDELAKEVGEDRAVVEALKRESLTVREEVEEERRMLQMAEVWREERVQMKLIDAKLTLEDQYSHLTKLQTELECFLRSRTGTNLDVAEIREAEFLLEAVAKSIQIQEMNEFSYQPPPASADIFSIFEELQLRDETKEREIEPCYNYNPASCASKSHTVSPATDTFLEKPTNGSCMEDDSEWETLSHGEDLGSSNSLGGSDRSNSEVSEVSRKKASSTLRQWKSSCPNAGGTYKKTSVKAISNGRVSNSGEMGFSPPSLEQWSSPDSVNSHVNRGMKKCIEWPRGIQKHSLKAKLLEARLESRKVQIRHVLKQKI